MRPSKALDVIGPLEAPIEIELPSV